MSKRKCVVCGVDPAAGFASIGDGFYCHGDDDQTPTCYERSQYLLLTAPRADSNPLASLSLEELLNRSAAWGVGGTDQNMRRGAAAISELHRRFLLLQQENALLAENLRVRETSQIPVIPRAAAELLAAAERERDEARESYAQLLALQTTTAQLDALRAAGRDLVAAREALRYALRDLGETMLNCLCRDEARFLDKNRCAAKLEDALALLDAEEKR